jgi:hypothetical protein
VSDPALVSAAKCDPLRWFSRSRSDAAWKEQPSRMHGSFVVVAWVGGYEKIGTDGIADCVSDGKVWGKGKQLIEEAE